ncbi:MAG: adenine deaminase [Bacteroidota bacterium]
MNQPFEVSGQLIDLCSRTIKAAKVSVLQNRIHAITELDHAPNNYILPGFIDSHIHIESSMLTPSSFGAIAVKHGTVATVSDPHEIANVCGIEGVDYMIKNSRQSPFNIFFGAPSCVPATAFETAGACIDAKDIEQLMQRPEIFYLTEMMNYPGVLHKDPEVMRKIEAARKLKKPIDGHAPGLSGAMAEAYVNAGISTDHECTTLDEALEKINMGMKILIREGSAAKNFNALHSLLGSHPEMLMFCSDDKHPDELIKGHINELVQRAIDLGYNIYDVLMAACINPIQHYQLPMGMLRVGDPADFIITNDLSFHSIKATYLKGQQVAANGHSYIDIPSQQIINNFKAQPYQISDFAIKAHESTKQIRVIEAIEGQLITHASLHDAHIQNGNIESDLDQDILKMVVVNRYTAHTKPAIAFIKNFNLKEGAIASTVGHDCHNIIAVGVDDESICKAVNLIIEQQGGIAVVNQKETHILPLPMAGLMSTKEGTALAQDYIEIDAAAKKLGTTLKAPFMTLSFMALLVIPNLKLSDKGLFDGVDFKFTPLQL